ncbi:MAG: MATE family efflux transporter, partial [Bacteroides sp.]
PFLMNLASCFIVILINQGLKRHGGELAIGAFGIVNRLVFLFIMIVMGINQGMQPIAGYNFGARHYDRVTQTLKLTICAATVVTTIGFLMGIFVPDWAVSIFTSDSELIALASEGLQIVVLFFPIVGFQMVASNFFQSIGMAGKAIFLSLTRQMLLLIPCLFILPRFYGQTGVWVSMPISDLAASLISAAMLWWQFRSFKKMSAK